MTTQSFESDLFTTSAGELALTFLGHGTLMFTFEDTLIHIDPYSRVADYAELPKADVVLITHDHSDHLDPQALAQVRTPETTVVVPEVCATAVPDGLVVAPGDVHELAGFTLEVLPAYNIAHRRSNGQPFHPPGEGVGYVLTFGDVRVYVAGDTENTPEMKRLANIDIAFLPMNLPYTMTPEMVADAAKAFRPKVLYPYHFGDTDTDALVTLLADEPGIEVRVRDLA
jgi:L-ascorbate metabolism protein UlaG (beta-lactamase superfamily)